MHQTPWLLATPLPHHLGAGTRIKRIYAQRMRIEVIIRDLKSHQFGFAQQYARTKCPKRLVVPLLIAALASFILWVLVLAAADRGIGLGIFRSTPNGAGRAVDVVSR